MITAITNKNQNLYDSLFNKADAILNAIIAINNDTPPEGAKKNDDDSYDIFINNINYHITAEQCEELANLADEDDGLIENGSVKIDNLSDYFSVLKSLSAIHPLFMRLPQDENMFEIDADTRTIHKPTGTNVYAVKGDHVAEVIYFKIDRYFDIVDLGNPNIKVLIQVTCVDENQETKNYLFNCTERDLDSEPDKVIFGWPLDSKITKNAGNITFSVRFYSIGAGLEYSLGTQPATLTIVSGLDYDVTNEKIIDTSTEIYLKNYQKTGAISVPVPVFLINMQEDDTTEDIDIRVLSQDNNTFKVSAIAGNATLDYNLYKLPLDDTDPQLVTTGKVEEIQYKEVESSEFNLHKGNLYERVENSYEKTEDTEYQTGKTYYYPITVVTWTLNLDNDNAGRYYCIVNAQSNRYTNQAQSRFVNVFGAASVLWKEFDGTTAETINAQYASYYPVTFDSESNEYIFEPDNKIDIFNPKKMLELDTTELKKGGNENTLSFKLPEKIEFNNGSTATNIGIKGKNSLNGNIAETVETKTIHLCKPIPEINNLTVTYGNDGLNINSITLSNAEYSNDKENDYLYILYSTSNPQSPTELRKNLSYNELIDYSKSLDRGYYGVECVRVFYEKYTRKSGIVDFQVGSN